MQSDGCDWLTYHVESCDWTVGLSLTIIVERVAGGKRSNKFSSRYMLKSIKSGILHIWKKFSCFVIIHIIINIQIMKVVLSNSG